MTMHIRPPVLSRKDAEVADYLFAEIGRRTKDVAGVSRPAYSKIETGTLEFLADFASENGLATGYDTALNGIYSLPQDADAKAHVYVGSHVDSVPQGGNYDGLAGVVCGLVCLLKAQREKNRFARPVRVLALRAEESAWFGPCYIASKALMGQLAKDERLARHKKDGKSLDDHMKAIGIEMKDIRAQKPLIDKAAMLAYLELHIEQGPLLIEQDMAAAVVSGIRGNLRHRNIRCDGEAGHSGAVPRAYRRDPVLAMADLLSRLDDSWLTILQKGEDLVLTSGMVATDPEKHAMSRIADHVCFSLDIRSQSAETLDDMRDMLAHEIKTIEQNRKVSFTLDNSLYVAPALCDPKIVDSLVAAMTRVGQEPFVMASGGGHDAAVFANAGVPTGMVFVRNRNGSHNPAEAMETADFLAASAIIYNYLLDRAP
jgi:N-carbamoyl-L-amino-acid hydrolase